MKNSYVLDIFHTENDKQNFDKIMSKRGSSVNIREV